MKLPDIKKPNLSGVPRPVEDLYRDMRDRRLLVPGLVLLIAIIAVPLALTVSKEEPPAPLAYVPPEGAEAVSPAVLTEQPIGVRDYRERLKELKSTDPFAPDPAVANQVRPGDVTTPPGEPVGSASPSPAPAAPAGGDMPSISTPDSGSPSSSPGNSAAPPAPPPMKEILVMEPRLSVMAGKAGNVRPINNLRIMRLLPTKKTAPVAQFMGTSQQLKFAHFAISGSIEDNWGDGSCTPSRSNCEFLRLPVGGKRVFVYGGERYVLKVKRLTEVVADRRKEPAK